MTRSLAYLSNLCRRWGGSLVLLPEPEFSELNYQSPGVSGAPDGWHAIDLRRRYVMSAEGRVNPGAVIHEMGHLFLKEGHPTTGYELDWIGWEIALARRAQCYEVWSRQNADYLIDVDAGREWRHIRGRRRQKLIADRIAHAKSIGIVSQGGEPLCTRRP